MKSLPVFFFLVLLGIASYSQDSVVAKPKTFHNTIKFNLTSRVLYDNAFQFGYERVFKNNQSLNVFGGYNEFPVNLNFSFDSSKLVNAKNKTGFSVGAEYRFYLKKENKYPAPRGVFLAPFISYYQFGCDRTLTHTSSSGDQTAIINTTLNFCNIGGELGYQFVIKNRWVIDAVVLGPSVTRYNFHAKMQGQVSGVSENEVVQKVIDAMKEKLPLLNEFVNNQEISTSGTERFWSVGFRYNISAGFRF